MPSPLVHLWRCCGSVGHFVLQCNWASAERRRRNQSWSQLSKRKTMGRDVFYSAARLICLSSLPSTWISRGKILPPQCHTLHAGTFEKLISIVKEAVYKVKRTQIVDVSFLCRYTQCVHKHKSKFYVSNCDCNATGPAFLICSAPVETKTTDCAKQSDVKSI